ncbi:hypothetical protein GOV10_06080 [Candidatus Woesearchaeota archaeon]|nr:hypothetical protein [Candidatus Woesearchaeota archaeon]
MADFKLVILALVIAVLFTTFTFTLTNAIYQGPEYSDYCDSKLRAPIKVECENYLEPQPQEYEICDEEGGYLEPIYNQEGCIESYECNTCSAGYEEAQEKEHHIFFAIMSLLGIISIIVSLIKKTKDKTLKWILNGFLLGGLASIFLATMIALGDVHRLIRPFIIIAELALVIYIALKKM